MQHGFIWFLSSFLVVYFVFCFLFGLLQVLQWWRLLTNMVLETSCALRQIDDGRFIIELFAKSSTMLQRAYTTDAHIPSQLKFLIRNFKHIVQTPLTAETHQLWKAQVMKLFSANGYSGFLTGELSCPNQFSISDSGEEIENPYEKWLLTDWNMVSALYAMILPSLLPYILNLNSYADIWATIERRL